MTIDDVLTLLSKMEFSPIERRILGKLVCGKPCKVTELLDFVYDGDTEVTINNLACHMTNIRKQLKEINHSILCEAQGRRHYYRYVILVTS